MYDLEEVPRFWKALAALDALGDPEGVADAIDNLVTWILQDPKRATENEDGIRVLKVSRVNLKGGTTASLRLAFTFVEGLRPNGTLGVVVLLDVESYDEAQERLESSVLPYHH